MERKGSQGVENKGVRIKLKTDPKQDPRLIKAEGKSALKKDNTPSPDISDTAQITNSQQRSSDTPEKRPSEPTSNTEAEANKKKSINDAEKLAEAEDPNKGSSNLKEVAEEEKPAESRTHEDASPSKLNETSTPSINNDLHEEVQFQKDPASSQKGVTEALKETVLMPTEGGRSTSNSEVNAIKEESISIPLLSTKVEDIVGSKITGNENDDSNRKNATDEAENLSEKEITVSSVHIDDDNAGDTPSTKISIKVGKKTNEDLNLSAASGKSENNQGTRDSDITTTLNSSSGVIKASTIQSVNVEEDTTTTTEVPALGIETNNSVGTHDNSGEKLYQHPVEGAKDTVENNSTDGQKDRNDNDGLPVLLDRTSGSEDLKLNEMKKRVRPGQVFVVREDPDCFTVRWAEKRKVLAYKLGSKNTSRFSTVLIETVEQLERASVRHPSIISELTHPTTGAKGSLLSTYFAGADARRSIKDNLIREAGTNTDHHNEFEARQESPDYNFYAKDHVSLDGEVFGGVAPNQPTTADPKIQSNNYNYPFLTDYDVNHERKVDK